MNIYDFSVVKAYEISSVDDAIKLLKTVKRLAFIGAPGLGKSLLTNLIEEQIDKEEFVIQRIKSPNIDEIRNVIRFYEEDFASQNKERLLIIDEADNASAAALDVLKCHTDESNAQNFIQIHVIYLKNNDTLPEALASRTIKIHFEYPTIPELIMFWKDSEVRKKLTEEQAASISSYLKKLNDDKERISHRDFGTCLKMMASDPKLTLEIALRYKRSDIFDEKEFTTELKDIYKAIKGGVSYKIVDALKKLKNEEKMNLLFNYIRSIAKTENKEDMYTKICNAQYLFLSLKWNASIYNTQEFNMNKYIMLFTCLKKAGVC